jgi:ribosomal protein S18 acetylase RimI-like enzyme
VQIEKDTNSHIRKLKDQNDLLQVADLMEICFGEQLDRDGREYIRQMRRAAMDARYMRWIPGASEMICMPMSGFVWEEDNKIVGNLTIIPYKHERKWIYLIANVAVHPDFRRQGIAKQLTNKALNHVQEHPVSSAWLQVRDDNPVAEHLYRELGFIERARRTVWQSGEVIGEKFNHGNALEIRNRSGLDWIQQREWLSALYPTELAWYLSFNLKRFDDQPLRKFVRWLDGVSIRHWSVYDGKELVGVLSCEPSRSFADVLWLAAPIEWESKVIRRILPFVRKELASQKPLSINFPAGHSEDAFLAAGFKPITTLIWMSISN